MHIHQERLAAERLRHPAPVAGELKEERNLTPRVVNDAVSMLRNHVFPHIGDMRIGEITRRNIVAMLDTVAATPDARRRKSDVPDRRLTHRPNRVFELVRSIFRWAENRDMLTSDPLRGVRQPIKKRNAA